MQSALKKLGLVSEYDAIQMMENTIAGEWQGLFELKNNQNGKPQKTNAEIFATAMQSDAAKNYRF